ncbi:hypothetical protein CSC3H3_07435 [Thalassospira marina]|uniref:Uncharacterized protein n=1 Tax=Thalassospira marina TaxID=2048283 RepID=A0A2N3KS45_9PROT|nr:hypothetical protein CSC3H3_07435 [Thalassospira marina]PKR53316.1 hypothetical protein COO20_14545 [Thalassospira marina]
MSFFLSAQLLRQFGAANFASNVRGLHIPQNINIRQTACVFAHLEAFLMRIKAKNRAKSYL